jgi:hypothetical protein
MNVTAVSQNTALYLVCPSVQLSTYLGVLTVQYPSEGDLSVKLIPADSGDESTIFTSSQDSTNFVSADVASVDDSMQFGSPVEEEYSGGFCFDSSAVTGPDTGINFEMPNTPPPTLTTKQCATEVANSCSEPVIFNRNLIFSADAPGAVEKGGPASALGRIRRSLSRARSSKDSSRLTAALRTASQSLNLALNLAFSGRVLASATTSSITQLQTLLRSKRVGSERRAKRAISILKKLEILLGSVS